MKRRQESTPYRGRIAPTPSGWLHLGHAATFTTAWRRARDAAGTVVYRTEDIDPDRCRPEYGAGAMEDLRWWGLDWDEGPDCGGPYGPYLQSRRTAFHREALLRLIAAGLAYPSPHSRNRIAAEHPVRSPVDGHFIFPPALREEPDEQASREIPVASTPWRFRVPDGRRICFQDLRMGKIRYLAGRDFGDFLLWRREDMPSYELAVVVDDHGMAVTEVVRGEDLLLSTARQILLYEALGWDPPAWYHCPLVMDPATGQRMAKTHRSLGLRTLRKRGLPPGQPPEAYF